MKPGAEWHLAHPVGIVPSLFQWVKAWAERSAWGELAQGADQAWERMRQAIAQARAYFEPEAAEAAPER